MNGWLQHYEDDGRPVANRIGQRGCPDGLHCTYAHPEDPQWATASLSNPPGPPPGPPLGSMRSSSPFGPPPPPAGPPPPFPPAPTHGLPPRPANRVERVASASSAHGSDRDREDDYTASRTRVGRFARDTSPVDSTASSSDIRMRRRSSSGVMPDRRGLREEERRYREEDRRREEERRREDDRRYDLGRRDDERRKEERRWEDDRRRRDEERRDRPDSRSRDRRSASRSRARRDSYTAPPPKKDHTDEEKRQIWIDRIK